MTEKCITYSTIHKLDCPSCLPVAAVLCIPSELVLPEECVTPDTTFTPSYIDATLTGYTQTAGSCGALHKYTFTYDDESLVEDTILLSSHITGAFCKGCREQWIEDKLDQLICALINTEAE